jgi:predicted regulator of Ras-like GTPase activity (Roadblock/LC7/MglB family)
VAKCGNAACSAGNTLTVVDSTGYVGFYPSIRIGSDGLPLIAHFDYVNGILKVAHCGNAACSVDVTFSTVDATGWAGLHLSLAIGADGLPIISYFDGNNWDLKVAKCGDVACSASNTLTTVDAIGEVGYWKTSITIGADALPVIAYLDATNYNLKVAKCSNGACSANNILTTVDATGEVGWYPSLAIGADGLPVVAYYGNNTLKMAHCSTANCVDQQLAGSRIAGVISGATIPGSQVTGAITWATIAGSQVTGAITGATLAGSHITGAITDATISGATLTQIQGRLATNVQPPQATTLTIVDAAGNVGYYPSLTIGADGLPVIAYYDGTNGDLKVAHCGNAACSSGNTHTTVDATGSVGWYPSLAIGADGLPVIAYYDGTNGDLKVAHCGNAACSAGNVLSTVDATGNVGYYPSLTIGADGLPVIAYCDGTNVDLKVAHCANAACTGTSTLTTVDSVGNVGQNPSLAIGPDGLPMIAYYDNTNYDLKVAHCGNANCSAANVLTTMDAAGVVGEFSSLTIGADGRPMIAYYDGTNGDLKVAHCGNAACSSANTLTTVDATGDVGYYPSLTIGTDGLPVIAYYANGDLKVAKCANAFCAPYFRRR